MGLGGGTTAMSIFGPSYGYGYGVQSAGGGGGIGGIVILGIIAALAISFLPGILSRNSSSLDDTSSAGEPHAIPKTSPNPHLHILLMLLNVLHGSQLMLTFGDPGAHSAVQLLVPQHQLQYR